MIKQAASPGVKVGLKDRGGRTAVAEGGGQVHIRVLRGLRPLGALETPVLAVCVHPGQPPPLALWKDVTHLFRVLARGHSDVPRRAVPGVLVAQTRAQVL
jgi:hypothetical protein